MQPMEVQETWSSRFVFIMAAVGAAVGLGNLWKFPYTAGVSGGAAFVLVYIGAIVMLSVGNRRLKHLAHQTSGLLRAEFQGLYCALHALTPDLICHQADFLR